MAASTHTVIPIVAIHSLKADCNACIGLCCVAMPFDRDQGFGFDKAAHEPCIHLDARDRCRIHGQRAAQGFSGCEGFDCLGAGQRVTRLFAGQSWREGEVTARAMFDAFFIVRQLHTLLVLLSTALQRTAPGDVALRLAQQSDAIESMCEPQKQEQLRAIDLVAVRKTTLELLVATPFDKKS